MKRTTVVLLGLVLGAYTYLLGQTQQYQFVDLGTLPNGTWSGASAINNVGQVAGTCQAGTTSHACFWFGGTIHDLGAPNPGEGSEAVAINDLGQVVGIAVSTQGADRAVMWSNGKIIELGTLGGNFSLPTAINNAGQVVGVSTDANGLTHAFLWQNGMMSPIDALFFATSINASGTVVGVLWNSTNGVIVRRGQIIPLGSLGGQLTLPESINNLGDVVGSSAISDVIDPNLGSVITHAFLYHQGNMVDLQTLPAALTSIAMDINGSGEIVGSYQDVTGLSHAVVWQNSQMVPLDVYVPPAQQTSAASVNAAGVIVGSGVGSLGKYPGHAFMLIPKANTQ